MYLSLRLIRSYMPHGKQVEIADAMGWHPNTMSRKMTGKVNLTLKEVNRIAELLEVGVEKFLSEEGN